MRRRRAKTGRDSKRRGAKRRRRGGGEEAEGGGEEARGGERKASCPGGCGRRVAGRCSAHMPIVSSRLSCGERCLIHPFVPSWWRTPRAAAAAAAGRGAPPAKARHGSGGGAGERRADGLVDAGLAPLAVDVSGAHLQRPRRRSGEGCGGGSGGRAGVPEMVLGEVLARCHG